MGQNSILNEWDKALHNEIHESMLKQDPSILKRHHRLKILDKLSEIFKIEGTIADIGCGNGYFGIGLAKRFPQIIRVDCIEASKPAVEEVIPRNIKFYNVDKIVKPIHGSFDDLGFDKYNMIFAMGALHHSQDLNKTISSIAKALKPNGILIAQEPAMPDNTTHNDYKFKYNIVEERFGLKIKNGDRYDRFFRECEYKYSLIINGFDICLWDDYEEKGSKKAKIIMYSKVIKRYLAANGYKKTFNKIVNSIKKEAKNQVLEPQTWIKDMQKAITHLKPKLFIAKKSDCEQIYHNK